MLIIFWDYKNNKTAFYLWCLLSLVEVYLLLHTLHCLYKNAILKLACISFFKDDSYIDCQGIPEFGFQASFSGAWSLGFIFVKNQQQWVKQIQGKSDFGSYWAWLAFSLGRVPHLWEAAPRSGPWDMIRVCVGESLSKSYSYLQEQSSISQGWVCGALVLGNI